MVQMINTEATRDVILSFVLQNKNRRDEIINISPARTTETEKPVNNIYRETKAMRIIVRALFLTLISVSRVFNASDNIDRCIPDKARI